MNRIYLIYKSFTVLLLLVSINSMSTLQAQNISVSGGLEFPALLVGDLGDNGRVGLGATARVQYGLNDQMAITATTGYIGFFNDLEGTSLGVIPLQGGLKYYFLDGIYGLGELGLHIFRAKFSILDVSATSTDADFSVGLGGGYEFQVGNLNLDVGGRFQIVAGGGSYIGVRTALVFPVRGNNVRRGYPTPKPKSKQGQLRGTNSKTKTKTATKKRQGTVK